MYAMSVLARGLSVDNALPAEPVPRWPQTLRDPSRFVGASLIEETDKQALTAWFPEHGRTYPWRTTKDSYLILVAAFMLQRTGGSQVMNVYPAFTARYPDFRSLARAKTSKLAEILRPLGRVSRLSQLLKLVEALERDHGGMVPNDLDALDRLPGMGQYSARSVMCMAFGKPYIMLDPNSYRVAHRAWGFTSTKTRPHTDRDLIAVLDSQVPAKDPKSFNLALLDLGSQVCRNRKPRHSECPLAQHCVYLKEDANGSSIHH